MSNRKVRRKRDVWIRYVMRYPNACITPGCDRAVERWWNMYGMTTKV